jgi:aminoglycoside phosphotransferase (APT) family kinase protein
MEKVSDKYYRRNCQEIRLKENLLQINLPKNVSILDVKHISEGETNEVYFCRGVLDRNDVNFFLKINKNPKINLKNEDEVLQAFQLYDFPVPRILFSCHNKHSFIALEEIQGFLLWDLIDPRRKNYDPKNLHIYLFEYGKWLALIHQLPLKWHHQKRPKLYEFSDKDVGSDPRFEKIISWLSANKPIRFDSVFVHGDYNPANVIFDEKEIKGIIDWEFAGLGWKEYDLAWALRARQYFLNSQKERNIILQGYSSVETYDPISLKWCEVLNYLHFADWAEETNSEYMNFALNKGAELC